jgi:hypothetical protein
MDQAQGLGYKRGRPAGGDADAEAAAAADGGA